MHEAGGKQASAPILRDAVRFWFKLGWISFGGTAAHLSIMHKELVERRGWISSEHFFHALSHCVLLPGPEAQQLAIYIGWKLHGKVGGVLAGVLFILPSLVILLALSLLYAKFGSTSAVTWAFTLLKPLVVVLVLRALLQFGHRALKTPLQWTAAAISLMAITLFRVSLPWVMGAALICGIAKALVERTKIQRQGEAVGQTAGELQVYDHGSSLRIVGACLLIAALPLVAIGLIGHALGFWLQLCGFFTRTAFVTLGGSYTVIPYVAQVAVGKYGWLTRAQMLDGFALAETTPGPLIIVVAYVGFMAGFHHFQGSLAMGSLALLLTCFYTFLPCFLFVFLGAPWVLRSHGSRTVGTVLELVNAVVVAAIVQLTMFLLGGVLFVEGIVGWRTLNHCAVCEIAVLALFLLRPLRKNTASANNVANTKRL